MVRDADDDDALIRKLAARLKHNEEEVERAYSRASRNVRTVLRRQELNTIRPTTDRPVCRFLGEEQLVKVLGTLPLEVALLALARVYDECHVTLCKALQAARKGQPHHEAFTHDPCVDLQLLTDQLGRHQEVVEDQILLVAITDDHTPLRAAWKPLPPMSFDHLPRLSSLSQVLPGEQSPCHEYAGIGGGGGSDIISASLLGHLLQRHRKQMDLLISTRTWATGSQGKKGSKMGIKREIYNHDGPAREAHGQAVAGTFRVKEGTSAEGRDLETIPLPHHSQIFIVLDQGESTSEIPENDKADLRDQFRAVLAQAKPPIDTVLIVDTGGDVFGADETGGTTPDQDFRVQRAIRTLSSSYNLVTAVVSPGVDAPDDAPQKALKAGGMVYKPTEAEKAMLLNLLASEYKMDGSDPSRFGKTILALQARLRGVVGWTSLDLPTYVVDTWDNPWNSFVYIRDCMSDIILMPTIKLLPLIEPSSKGR
ncbi:uncharacterized protein Z518_05030 [Rhinocladiella mackenziei CBS 650.93]|uniref:Rhinocladiella mackenziei CBS 650.93 unplaced genomic scaffold supercont1.3, whole genome shotgun sequence n=1 Tax=Rhinocladiella mackenziei CBS 650.93 TaxID=1442369 RepID=A0A0D2H9A0_9EURO|nr:uncharacterized protein Z518_05030 [Rhinocladiella mackenziei CBS 650.93]KIX07053.1 hypothetical protein Z518_05030 [Rhinocladiella mackenziei CBS 650.93]